MPAERGPGQPAREEARAAAREGARAEAASPACAILVLNFNGRRHLEVLLPSLVAARERYRGPLALVVVDNRSTEPDVEYVRQHFPSVEVVVAARNDYMFSLNDIVAARPEEVVILLNNDMRVDPDFVEPLVGHFADRSVFAVSAYVQEWDGSAPQIGQRLLEPRRYWVGTPMSRQLDGLAHTAEAGGGCAAFRREYFTALGGFDRLYWPAYIEDLDLTYRAWKRGWRSLVEPRSVIYHRGGATLYDRADGTVNSERERRMQQLGLRNLSLFMLKNVDGWRFVAGFVALLPWRVVSNALTGRRVAARAFLASIPLIPRALAGRRATSRPGDPSAAEIAAAVHRAPELGSRAAAA